MARIRTIKPQHWTDKELSKISLQAHLLWIGMWNFSDDEGIIDADPLLLKSNIFPRRTDVRIEQVSQWLDQLVKARFIIPFDYMGEGYYIHRTFKTHQKIDRPQKSKIPSEIIQRLIGEDSANVRGSNVEDSNGEVEEGIATPKIESVRGEVFFNVEEIVLKNPIWFEKILMATGTEKSTGALELHKYHLFLEEKEQYPKPKKSLLAGFEKWLINAKKFNNGGTATNRAGDAKPAVGKSKGATELVAILKDELTSNSATGS